MQSTFKEAQISAPQNTSKPARRRLLGQGLLSLLAGLIPGRTSDAQSAAAQSVAPTMPSSDLLKKHMRQGNPPVQPLDTMVLFERGDDNNGRAMTHEVLSLIHEEKGKNSFPWTLYSSLKTHHEVGDACVVCSRLHKHGPGWSSGLHSEVFSHDRAVALGVNVEMSSDYAGPESTLVIGVNIQAVAGPRAMQYGVQVHDGAGHFETAVGLNGRGTTGVDMAGHFDVGLNTHDNNIRLNEGACIELDGQGQIKLRYRNGRIEFLNGERCVAHLDMTGEDHGL